ncbi:MAG: HD domain-containing protein, partial [Acholeplasmataceae bacterium]|nr:HD domain-containing protein [Acholeplasmataceae bacterium]
MNNSIPKVIKFIERSFDESSYPCSELDSKKYRLEHTFRVANIGKQIAINENFDVDALVTACLLHDISYTESFNSQEDWKNHGRRAAQISRPFLETLDFDQETKNNILLGIAIHVDGKSDFEGDINAFSLSVGDADNIDRFDVYRFYEMLKF